VKYIKSIIAIFVGVIVVIIADIFAFKGMSPELREGVI